MARPDSLPEADQSVDDASHLEETIVTRRESDTDDPSISSERSTVSAGSAELPHSDLTTDRILDWVNAAQISAPGVRSDDSESADQLAIRVIDAATDNLAPHFVVGADAIRSRLMEALRTDPQGKLVFVTRKAGKRFIPLNVGKRQGGMSRNAIGTLEGHPLPVFAKTIDISDPMLRDRAMEEDAILHDLADLRISPRPITRVESSTDVTLVMEAIRGLPVDAWMEQTEGFRSEEDSLWLSLAIADSLARLHKQGGVVSRDMKPGNLFIDSTGAFETGVPVIDTGLARNTHSELGHTSYGVVAGTPALMSPAHLRGLHSVDDRGDMFAYGLILHQLITGERIPTSVLRALQTADMSAGVDTPEYQAALDALVQRNDALEALIGKVDNRIIRLIRRCLAMKGELRPRAVGAAFETTRAAAGQSFDFGHASSEAQTSRTPDALEAMETLVQVLYENADMTVAEYRALPPEERALGGLQGRNANDGKGPLDVQALSDGRASENMKALAKAQFEPISDAAMAKRILSGLRPKPVVADELPEAESETVEAEVAPRKRTMPIKTLLTASAAAVAALLFATKKEQSPEPVSGGGMVASQGFDTVSDPSKGSDVPVHNASLERSTTEDGQAAEVVEEPKEVWPVPTVAEKLSFRMTDESGVKLDGFEKHPVGEIRQFKGGRILSQNGFLRGFELSNFQVRNIQTYEGTDANGDDVSFIVGGSNDMQYPPNIARDVFHTSDAKYPKTADKMFYGFGFTWKDGRALMMLSTEQYVFLSPDGELRLFNDKENLFADSEIVNQLRVLSGTHFDEFTCRKDLPNQENIMHQLIQLFAPLITPDPEENEADQKDEEKKEDEMPKNPSLAQK